MSGPATGRFDLLARDAKLLLDRDDGLVVHDEVIVDVLLEVMRGEEPDIAQAIGMALAAKPDAVDLPLLDELVRLSVPGHRTEQPQKEAERRERPSRSRRCCSRRRGSTLTLAG